MVNIKRAIELLNEHPEVVIAVTDWFMKAFEMLPKHKQIAILSQAADKILRLVKDESAKD